MRYEKEGRKKRIGKELNERKAGREKNPIALAAT